MLNKLLYNIALQLDKEEKEKEIKNKRIKEENAAGKEAFNANKSTQTAGIIMNAASSIMAAWNTTIPAPAGQIVAAIETAFIGGMAIKQISDVDKQKFVPKPLIAAGGGIFQGPLHAAGGINLGSVEAEGGEFIINRASTQAYSPLLNTINQAGNTTGNSNEVSDIIDYNKLAGLINSQEVIIVDSKINDSQKEVAIKDSRTSF